MRRPPVSVVGIFLALALSTGRAEAVEVTFTFPDESLRYPAAQACAWVRCPDGLSLAEQVAYLIERHGIVEHAIPQAVQRFLETISGGERITLQRLNASVEVRP